MANERAADKFTPLGSDTAWLTDATDSGQVQLPVESATGQGLLKADLYFPTGQTPIGVMLVLHGMSEHRRRYARFAKYMSEHGLIVLVYDQAGHGESAFDESFLGHFADRQGDQKILQDLACVHRHLVDRYPALPLFLVGHSMGSLIVRDYLRSVRDPVSGVVLTGTAGPNPVLPVGWLLAQLLLLVKGPKHRSKLLDNILHQGFLSRVPSPNTAFDWLSRDAAVVSDYIRDPFCGFPFTTAAMLDLIAWTNRVSQSDWPREIPQDLPIYLASGQQDPVGQYGRGVLVVANRLSAAGLPISLKIYPDSRHEILNETNQNSVFADIHDWVLATMVK